MSNIKIINVSDKVYSNIGRYFSVELESGKNSIIVEVGSNGIFVIVQNASHKVWRGAGKQFKNLEVALSAYKKEAIKNMIQVAVDMSKENQVQAS